MSVPVVHVCQCIDCREPTGNQEVKDRHEQMNWFISKLTKDQRRWYAGLEANRIGRHGTSLVTDITGLSRGRIRRGRAQITAYGKGQPEKARRRAGRPSIERIYPNIKAVLEELLGDDIAGDPMCEKRWVRRSSRHLSKELAEKGYIVNYRTVCYLLKDIGFSMMVNVRHRASTAHSPERDTQFDYIKSQKTAFLTSHLPVISVDAKKKELIGNFRANGKAWCKSTVAVSEYRFASMAQCIATPYGVYDIPHNKGYVYVGTSVNSPQFAVMAIRSWWKDVGCRIHAGATRLLVLADGGGSNGARSRAWKKHLQTQLCDSLGLTVTVCHYPPGCSKYNPVERQLFAPISTNWAGKPLQTLNLILGYIRGTTTKRGLTVDAFLLDGSFPRREPVTAKELRQMSVEPHSVCPEWNYTITPRGQHSHLPTITGQG